MKKNKIFKIALTVVFAFTISTISAQIYSADFSTNNDGFPNHSTANPPAAAPANVGPFGSSGNQWSLNYTSKPSTDATDNIFKVSDGALQSDDWGGQGVFQSQSIDVSGISFVNISATTINIGANDDNFEYFYILDGGSRIGTGNISSNSDDTLNYSINNLNVSGASTLIVGFEFSENGAGQGYSTSSFTVTNTGGIATPGITLGAASGNTSENGTTATFTVTLNAKPLTDVQLSVSSGNTSEVTVDLATLTFTNANWNLPQTVTVTGIDDILFDGNVDVLITIAVKDSTSDDTYDALEDVTITITNNDDDVAPVIGFDYATSSELETNSTFTSASIPVSVSNYSGTPIEIEISVSGGTAESGDYTFTSPTTLSFNSNGTQNITVEINNDIDTEDEEIIFTITETSAVTSLTISQTTHTLTITDDEISILPNIIINEILADPGSIDANGDGTANTFTDEFIELVNLDIIDHNLTDYTISDEVGIKHTFGAIIIPAGGSVVIFGGGNPTNIPGITVISNGLSLNNTGDSVTLKDATGNTITSYTYGTEGNDDQSIARNNDLTGNFVKHSEIASNPVLASPGRYNATGQPFSINTWTGTTNNSWSTASNWSLGITPGTTDNVQIVKTTNQPTTSGAVTLNSVTIASDATLIATNTFSGTVTFNRTLANSNQWYFMSSPVMGEVYDNDWANSNSILSGQNLHKGISYYDNSSFDTDTDAEGSDTETGYWRYLKSDNSNSGSFAVGRGYGIIRATSGTVSFIGNGIYTSTQTTAITKGDSNFNMVGNPFTAYLNLGNFFADNPTTSVLAAPEIYLWNGSSYDTKTAGLNSSYQIAPGQGFFVEAAANSNITFDIANVSHQNTATFQKNGRPEIHLLLSEGLNTRYANIYYIDGTTTGFDSGYDGKLFGGISHNFAIYSHLVTNDEGKKYQLQSLPNSDYENMVIPIGIDADAGKEIMFTAESFNLPSEIKVFLEDRFTNTFTRLDEVNANYKVTLTDYLNGIGRFYIHTSAKSTLNAATIHLENISLYKTRTASIKIVGLSAEKATLKLFNILGKQVFNVSFSSDGVQEITLPKLATGIYIAQLETKNGKLNKKITIE